MSNLGRLTQITDLRSQWPDEARDFTPWLANEENLALLGETLGQSPDWLELVTTEASVGRFSADILCKDTGADDTYVVIENQFGYTDHDHLGKSLTYAAGLKAKTIIWVAQTIRDEHRAALDMLNTATSDDYQFFGIEIELWRIGDSPVAPRFNVVAKPNDWSRAARQTSTGSSALTPLKKMYIRYWADFKLALSANSKLRAQKASPQQWIYLPIGRSSVTLTANVHSQKNWIQAQLELHGVDGAVYFEQLKRDQTAIDATAPFALTWEDLPNRKGARISVRLENADPTDENQWPAQHAWLVETLNALHAVFHDRVKALDLTTTAKIDP